MKVESVRVSKLIELWHECMNVEWVWRVEWVDESVSLLAGGCDREKRIEKWETGERKRERERKEQSWESEKHIVSDWGRENEIWRFYSNMIQDKVLNVTISVYRSMMCFEDLRKQQSTSRCVLEVHVSRHCDLQLWSKWIRIQHGMAQNLWFCASLRMRRHACRNYPLWAQHCGEMHENTKRLELQVGHTSTYSHSSL